MCVWSMCAYVHNETHDTDQISFKETGRGQENLKFIQQNLVARQTMTCQCPCPQKRQRIRILFNGWLNCQFSWHLTKTSQVGGFFGFPGHETPVHHACTGTQGGTFQRGCSLSKQWAPGGCTSSSLPMEIPTTIYNFYNLINLPDVTMAFWGEVSHPIQWVNTQEVWSSVAAD